MGKTKQLVIYEVSRTARVENCIIGTVATYYLEEAFAKIAEEHAILKSQISIRQGEPTKYRVKYAEHTISIPHRECVSTGNQFEQLMKDIKRGKVECEGFKDPATLAFDNAENERITEINE